MPERTAARPGSSPGPGPSRGPAAAPRDKSVDISEFLSLAGELAARSTPDSEPDAAPEPFRAPNGQQARQPPSLPRPPVGEDARYAALVLYLDERLEELRQTVSRQSLRHEAFLRAEALRQRRAGILTTMLGFIMAGLILADILVRR